MQNNQAEEYISNIEKAINYQFRDKGLLLKSLTHSSYSNENNLNYNYERLEFLGDAVLELVITEYIVLSYSSFQEGSLSSLRAYIVNESTLYDIASGIGLHKNIFVGRSEFKNTDIIRKAIVADIFEALIAAVYLDGGYEKVRDIILSLFKEYIDTAVKTNSYKDAKTMLQQLCQRDFGRLPEYILISETGPDHDKTFEVEVNVCGKFSTKGTGRTKKKAEKEAACTAIRIYNQKING